MPTNYGGNRNGVQTPSVAPGPGVVPTFALPADGDNDNAATFAQSLKTAADAIAWLNAPGAIASAWAQPTWYTQNALGQQRFLVDHLGFPGGRVARVVERWRGSESNANAGSLGFTQTSMLWSTLVGATAGAQIAVGVPNPATIPQSHVDVTLGTTAGDQSLMFGEKVVNFGANRAIAIEWDVFLGAGVNQQRIFIGLAASISHAFADDSAFLGAGFIVDDSAPGAWYVNIGDGTTLGTAHNSGISTALSALFKLRMEYTGSGVADDGVAAIRFYVNGADAGVFTAGLPAPDVAPSTVAPVIGTKRISGATARSFSVGPVSISYTP